MATRKSIMHPVVEEWKNSSPTSSSPLRRKSSIGLRTVPTVLEENDDEAERHVRRLEKNQPAAGRNDKRKSMGLGFVAQMSHPQIAERVTQCIKLSAENKINIKNAFSLEMIDFMAYMVKKQDDNMTNLQTASTSLDVSTKIYGFRVDGVHSDILKMIGGMDKQEKNDGRRDSQGGAENNEIPENPDAPLEGQTRTKKKRKNKQKILSTVEALRGTVETINPESLMFADGDSQTTDRLYQAILPHHANCGIYLHPYNDVLLDTVDRNVTVPTNDRTVSCPKIENFADNDICESFANFAFLDWSPDDEIDLSPEKSQTTINEDNNLQFDLDASLPNDEEATDRGLNYFDIEDRDDDISVNVDRCRGELINGQTANIVDFRQVVQASRRIENSEYSYLQDVSIQWAGPSHWKIRHAAKNLGGSRIVEGCGQEAVRRKKELNLVYGPVGINNFKPKFETSRANNVRIQAKTAKNYWSEDKITLPRDVHHESREFCKHYLRPAVIIKFPNHQDMNSTHVSDEVGDYDYNNEKDTTDYCPNIDYDEQPSNDDNANNPDDFGHDIGTLPTQPFTGDNLVEAPKVNNKIFIPYSQRAKKIDMRQIKRAMWKNLTIEDVVNKENFDVDGAREQENSDKINGTKTFSTLYKNLPKYLSKSNTEALSVPIAFMSILHLANEKSLLIIANNDNSDLFIQQD